MSLVPRISFLAWIGVVVLACGFLVWSNCRRAERVRYVSGLADQTSTGPEITASPAGNTAALPRLIVPERNEVAFGWLAQNHLTVADGRWRVRWVDYDNAPYGRAVYATSLYRWWLGTIAWIDRVFGGHTPMRAMERTALFAEPMLHAILLIGAVAFVAWRFGGLASVTLASVLVALFPFSAGYLPGVPDHHGLARAFALASGLFLLAGAQNRPDARRWFALGGIAGGVGMWIDVPTLLPILTGTFLGALLAAITKRMTAAKAQEHAFRSGCWRIWSCAGAATILVGYLVEYFPEHLGAWRLEWIHPLYGLAWLGAGVLLDVSALWSRKTPTIWTRGRTTTALLAAIALASVSVAMHWAGTGGWRAADLLTVRLTSEPDGVMATSSWAWLARDGLNRIVAATFLPLALVIPAIWLSLRKATSPQSREAIALAVGPVIIVAVIAGQQLSGWHTLDVALIVLSVAIVPTLPQTRRWITYTLVALIIAVPTVPGVMLLFPKVPVDASTVLTASEAQELVERDLARWLTRHSMEARPVVFAPPHETTTLCFYGGLRGIGTFDPANRFGLGASLMITGAKSMVEVEAAIQARGIRYIIIPSWDPFFDEFARLYLVSDFSNRVSFLVDELRHWKLPLWLRPLAYQMPIIPGFEAQSVLVFEVIDEQSPAVAASRLTEYFVETGRLDYAGSSVERLRRFPGDIGALVAEAQVMNAQENSAAFARTLQLLLTRLSTGADRYLPWDRRVCLATVLAQGGQMDLARQHVQRCLAEITENKLRSLTAGSLYRFLVLRQAFKLEIADNKLNALALDLLPPELRAQL